MSDTSINKLLRAAEAFQTEALWNDIPDNIDIVIEVDSTNSQHWCTVMGQGGMEFGLLAFPGEHGREILRSIRSDIERFPLGMQPEEWQHLAFTLTNRTDLSKEDKQLLKTYNIKSKGNYHMQFRQYEPFCQPRMIQEPEALLLANCLEGILAAKKAKVLTQKRHEKNACLLCRRESEKWHFEWVSLGSLRVFALPQKANIIFEDELLVRKIQKLPRTNAIWEAGVMLAPGMLIRVPGEAPGSVTILIVMDAQQDRVLTSETDTKTENLFQQLALRIAAQMVALSLRPTVLQVLPSQAYAVRDFADKTGIRLEETLDRPEHIAWFLDGLYAHTQDEEAVAQHFGQTMKKTNEKLFLPVPKKRTYLELLKSRSKAELVEIAKHYGLQPTLKAELVSMLEKQLPTLIQERWRLLDEGTTQRLFDAAVSGELVVDEADRHVQIMAQLDLTRGVLFPVLSGDTCKMILPQELDLLFQIDEKLQKQALQNAAANFTLADRCFGILEYSGIIPISELSGMLRQIDGKTFQDTWLQQFLVEWALNSLTFRVRHYDDEACLYDSSLIRPEEVLAYQKNVKMPYKLPSLSMLTEIGEQGGMPPSKWEIALVEYLMKNYSMSEDMAEGFVDELLEGFQNGENPKTILSTLIAEFYQANDKAFAKFSALYFDMYNNTPQYILKGNTPSEYSKWLERITNAPLSFAYDSNETAVRNKLVGRNDPCPCGSGKKYKFCCGK